MIAIQTLERIEYIHSKDYIHRDIKPANFLIGNPDNYLIYLIDFGNSRKYRSSRTRKHIKNFKIKKIFGTPFFLSLNVLRGNEQSRRDDLESLGYMYIYLSKGRLPWSNLKVKNVQEILNKTYKIKANISIEKLCENMPIEMCEYMSYVRNLTFENKPNYNYLRGLFLLTLYKLRQKNDNLFSWVVPNKEVIYTSPIRNLTRNKSHEIMKRLIESHSKEKELKTSKIIQMNERNTHYTYHNFFYHFEYNLQKNKYMPQLYSNHIEKKTNN